jgi:hypothetical protein
MLNLSHPQDSTDDREELEAVESRAPLGDARPYGKSGGEDF